MSKKVQNWAVPLIAVLLGMLIGAVLMLIFGYDPFWAYYDLFTTAFGSLKNIGEILRAMSPLILIALGFAVASKAGFFNVGLPGQALAGWVSAVGSLLILGLGLNMLGASKIKVANLLPSIFIPIIFGLF